jgi:hypothetical protein
LVRDEQTHFRDHHRRAPPQKVWRYRRLGARSIETIGLLHPVVISKDNVLIAGERRIRALLHLGRVKIPVTVIDLDEIVLGEYAENADRKDFQLSEVDAIRRVYLPIETEAAKERQGNRADLCDTDAQVGANGKTVKPKKVRAVDKVGAFAGISGRTIERVAYVMDALAADPVNDVLIKIVAKMDDNSNANGAYKAVKAYEKESAKAAVPVNLPLIAERYKLITSDIRNADIAPGSIDCIVTDPPYPHEFIDVFGYLASAASSLSRGRYGRDHPRRIGRKRSAQGLHGFRARRDRRGNRGTAR